MLLAGSAAGINRLAAEDDPVGRCFRHPRSGFWRILITGTDPGR